MPAVASPPCAREQGSSSNYLQPSLGSVVPCCHLPHSLCPQVPPLQGVGVLALDMARGTGGLPLLLLSLAVLDLSLGKG